MTVVETYATLEAAARAMGGDAAFIGGGTLVMRDVNEGRAPARLIRSTEAGLNDVRVTGDSVRIGAGVTMTGVLASRDLAFLHPVARQIGGPQVRNMATVAGNLFAGHPYGDFAAALLALDARVIGAGQSGARPVAEVLRDRERAGLIAAIEVPRPRDRKAFGFLKVSRVKPKGISVLSIAASLPQEGGRIRAARVVFGAMGPAPLRATGVERALEGQPLGRAAMDAAAAAAVEGLDPPTDEIASAWYRKEVAGVHLKRLLTDMERR
jgi:CO/xanthine dehydrogenase FAD-binding subunit